MRTDRFNFVGIFCGVGFGARGTVAAGGNPSFSVDLWGIATSTYKHNSLMASVHTDRVEEQGSECTFDSK